MALPNHIIAPGFEKSSGDLLFFDLRRHPDAHQDQYCPADLDPAGLLHENEIGQDGRADRFTQQGDRDE